MELSFVAKHQNINAPLSDSEAIFVPDALLVMMGCNSKSSFLKSMCHCTYAFDHTGELLARKYCKCSAEVVFRSANSQTCILDLKTEKILLEHSCLLSLNKISNVSWQNDHSVSEFMGILEAKTRLGTNEFTDVCRNDRWFWAFALSDQTINRATKAKLKDLQCEFGVNVAYGGRTHRSLLVPKCLINTTRIEHDGTYSILTMKPAATHILASEDQLHLLGLTPSKCPRDLVSLMKELHTAEEYTRISTEILPKILQLNHSPPDDRCTHRIEFITPRGKESFLCTYILCRGSCVVVTFSRP